MSVVLVCLPNGPKVSEEAVRKDAELNRYLESRVEGKRGGGVNRAVSHCGDDLLSVFLRPGAPSITFSISPCLSPAIFRTSSFVLSDFLLKLSLYCLPLTFR